MKQKEVLIKVTKSEFGPVVKVVIEIGQCGNEMSNKKEPSIEDIFNTEMPNVRKVCGYKLTNESCDYQCLERNFWEDEC